MSNAKEPQKGNFHVILIALVVVFTVGAIAAALLSGGDESEQDASPPPATSAAAASDETDVREAPPELAPDTAEGDVVEPPQEATEADIDEDEDAQLVEADAGDAESVDAAEPDEMAQTDATASTDGTAQALGADGKYTVAVVSVPPGARLTVDDQIRGRLPKELKFDPSTSKVRIKVKMDGYKNRVYWLEPAKESHVRLVMTKLAKGEANSDDGDDAGEEEPKDDAGPADEPEPPKDAPAVEEKAPEEPEVKTPADEEPEADDEGPLPGLAAPLLNGGSK